MLSTGPATQSAQEFVVKREKKLQNSVMVQKHFVIKIYAPFTNELAYETERDSQTQRTNLWFWAGGWGEGEGIVREFGMGMCTLLYLKWIANKDLLYSTGNSAQCQVAAWLRGEFGGEWIHVYTWLSLFAIYLKLSQCC